jgi:dUTP pyrophosphatase
MLIKPLHSNFIMPVKGTQQAGAWDLFMPTDGVATIAAQLVPLGFSTALPVGYVGLMFPRSGVGAKRGLELNNTCGVIDSDYRGEWKVSLRVKNSEDSFEWKAGERLVQVLIVPVMLADFIQTNELPESQRGAGGFGSTGG